MSGTKDKGVFIRLDPEDKVIIARLAKKTGLSAPEITRRGAVLFAAIMEEKGIGWVLEQTVPDIRDAIAKQMEEGK